ncbi:3456_t:CDS:10, partial [Funneliformis geosporum]
QWCRIHCPLQYNHQIKVIRSIAGNAKTESTVFVCSKEVLSVFIQEHFSSHGMTNGSESTVLYNTTIKSKSSGVSLAMQRQNPLSSCAPRSKPEENSAWNHYLSALEKLSHASDREIRAHAKRRKEEAMSLKLRKGQLEDFWLSVEIENAQASFEVGMRCIQLKNQVVDAERHRRQFKRSSKCSSISARDEQTTPSTSEYIPTDESDDDVIVQKRKKDDDANEKEDIVPANEDADKSKLYEELANDVVDIISERLEDIWRTVMKRLEDKKIRVQSIESRIIDLTNWTNLEWSRILKHEDKIALMKSFNKKLEKERIDQKVLDFIDNPSNSLRNLNDLQEWKTKISTIGSEDAILASEIISFFHKCCRREINILTVPLRERDYTLAILGPLLGDLLQEFNIGQFELFWIEKICNATNSRKRKSLNAEYIELNRDNTKLDMSLEFRNFKIEIMTVEVGNTEMKKDELKLQSDHTAIKIELKDMIDDFYNKLHFNKKDLADIYTIGIQVTGHHWSIYSLSYDHDLNFYFFTELATLDVPKSPTTMRGLLPTFIKTLLGLRHTLLTLNDKILSITSARRERKSTPSPPSSPPHETSETPKLY